MQQNNSLLIFAGIIIVGGAAAYYVMNQKNQPTDQERQKAEYMAYINARVMAGGDSPQQQRTFLQTLATLDFNKIFAVFTQLKSPKTAQQNPAVKDSLNDLNNTYGWFA